MLQQRVEDHRHGGYGPPRPGSDDDDDAETHSNFSGTDI